MKREEIVQAIKAVQDGKRVLLKDRDFLIEITASRTPVGTYNDVEVVPPDMNINGTNVWQLTSDSLYLKRDFHSNNDKIVSAIGFRTKGSMHDYILELDNTLTLVSITEYSIDSTPSIKSKETAIIKAKIDKRTNQLNAITEKYVSLIGKKRPVSKRDRKYVASKNKEVNEKLRRALKSNKRPKTGIRTIITPKHTNIQTTSILLSSKIKFYSPKVLEAKEKLRQKREAQWNKTHSARLSAVYPFNKPDINKSLVCIKNIKSGIIDRVTRIHANALVYKDSSWEYVSKKEWKLYQKVNQKEIQQPMPSNRAKYRYEMGKRKLKNIPHQTQVIKERYVYAEDKIDVSPLGDPYIGIDKEGNEIPMPQIIKRLERLTGDSCLRQRKGKTTTNKNGKYVVKADVVKTILRRIPMPQQQLTGGSLERVMPELCIKWYTKEGIVKWEGTVIDEPDNLKVAPTTYTKRVVVKRDYRTKTEQPLVIVSYPKLAVSTKKKKWHCPMPEKKVNPVKSK